MLLLPRRKPITTKGTQSFALCDTTRTLSKVHARLDRVEDEWVITDLNSTNASPSTEASSFILGSLAMPIAFDGPSA